MSQTQTSSQTSSSHSKLTLIDVNTKRGKKFVNRVEELRKSMKVEISEKTKFLKDVTGEMVGFPNIDEDLILRKVSFGCFGRKAGYTLHPSTSGYFRFILHLGSDEMYYLQNDTTQDEGIPMKSGKCIVLKPSQAEETLLVVYEDTKRGLYDTNVGVNMSRVRPLDYKRMLLIYDFELKQEVIDLDDDENIDEVETNASNTTV